MRWIMLGSILILMQGCLQAENTSSLDSIVYNPNGVRSIFAAKCSSCHYHSFETMSDADLVVAAQVVPGDPDASKIFYRLADSTAPSLNGPKNMPSDGGSLTAEEVETIRAWIENLQN